MYMVEIGKNNWTGSRRGAAGAEAVRYGEGVSPVGVGSGEGAVPPPQKIFEIFA